MSIQSEINRIKTAKSNIIDEIEAKGVSVPTDASIDDLSALVQAISIQKPEQTKSVTITTNGTTTITPDSGKVLSSVSVTTNITYKNGNEVSY